MFEKSMSQGGSNGMPTQANEWDERISHLERMGWNIKRNKPPRLLPRALHKSFDWVPPEIRRFTEAYEELSSPDEKAWLLTEAEFSGRSPSAFAWNEFEKQSTAAAGKDAAELARVTDFWKKHFPILLSVKSGYAYCAIAREGLTVVSGEGPEYENITAVAESFDAFLEMLAGSDDALAAWV